MAYAWSRLGCGPLLGWANYSTSATVALDSAYVHGTSGDAVGCRFVAPVSQASSSITVYAYCTAVTGSPTDVRCRLYDGPGGSDDVDRPSTSAHLAESSGVDCSAEAASWVAFTITSALTAGQIYYLLIHNATASPDANYPTFPSRALPVIGHVLAAKFFHGCYTAAGYSADGTNETSAPAMVIKFSDGTLLGNPFVTTEAHASNTYTRGICVTPTEDVTVSGIYNLWNYAAITAAKIRVHGGSDVSGASATAQRGAQSGSWVGRFAPTTLTGGTRYDILLTYSGNTQGNIYTMGEASPPADVQACVWPGSGYIDDADGTPATDNTKTLIIGALVDDWPAISGGSGGVYLTQTSGVGLG